MSQIDYFLEDDYLEVLMTYQSFEKLQGHYKDFVVPANIKKVQRFYNPKKSPETKNWLLKF